MSKQVPQEAFKFLKKLAENNDRDWFNEHKSEFKSLQSEVKEVFEDLLVKVQEHDRIQRLKVFRIYRDIRFSKDKTPYKTHISANYIRIKPDFRGSYYLHLEPGNSFIGAGFWAPEKDDLLRIRKEFEMDADEMREILKDKTLIQHWGNLQGDELKTAPRDFDKEHQNIDLIRKKQFIFSKALSDELVLSDQLVDHVNDAFKAIRPFFDYMTEVLTTDENGVSLIQ